MIENSIAINVENVYKSYNGSRVLCGVSLEVKFREFYVLMGPNGSGKSTLLSIIAGTNPSDSGSIQIHSHRISNESTEGKRQIGYVPQENFCSAFLTGRENLEYFAGLLGLSKSESKDQIQQLLEMMQLDTYADQRVAKYSGGMRKKLEVATALLGDVKVLLLDEPSTGLDPGVRKDFLSLLREINEQGTTILLVTHIGEDAEAATRVGFMIEGEIVAEETPDNLKAISGLRSTVVIDATPKSQELLTLLASLDDECGVVENSQGFKIVSDNPIKLISRIKQALLESGYHLNSVETRPPSLEDVFYQLTEMPVQGDVQ
ncbi:MAG: ABC transporter ATP-binding protein [Candidatus Thorarchaeota archaeon]|nr:ABC transporter ATP-binding protein [Candidatus Thorarchaeota archaeon]